MSYQAFGKLQILRGVADLSTLLDDRGGIFTWIPNEEIKEFNLVLFEQGKLRGNHFHPEFTEYFLVVEGVVAIFTEDLDSKKTINTIGSSGFLFKALPGVPHAIKAITPAKCISLITKEWDRCKIPLVYVPLVE